ncbi:putative GTP-binding protein 6 [Anthonomus grandis grandis]|uniref:putative GTP-binding protein 6 n=1 Tax=Anthonomus grandis grandis TaxID=2921223 RepID=UPI0021662FFF|nr:putative GTP-binding protein 6 [Anthonomus grandis grandis]
MLNLRNIGRVFKGCVPLIRPIHISPCVQDDEPLSENVKELLTSDSEYNKLVDHFCHIKTAHRCLVIQPYVKWGPSKLSISPEEQLSEAVALIQTLPSWSVEETLRVPLDSLDRKSLFKSGSMEKIRNMVLKRNDISAIFINSGTLKKATVEILQENFQRPVLDKYKIVMQILKEHATSKHAKLQVALAELYYIQRKSEKELYFKTYSSEALRLMFQSREKKIKEEIKQLRNQRNLLRKRRQKMDYPIIAVVGYTNSGKTSIIKVLTGEKSLQPKNQLFATLDVTVHEGDLPSGLNVLYVDTVGFISDIPANLVECFVATLEDALLADVIIHVEDISSESYDYKRKHVLDTLERLEKQSEGKDILSKVIPVGNKCDLLKEKHFDQDLLLVSAQKGIGLDELKQQLEDFVLFVTGRKKITIRIPTGGEEIRWLYKNATVLNEIPDQEDLQFIFAKVIITQSSLQKFKSYFI